MPHPSRRAFRAGYALVLLPTLLGSASSAPAHGPAAPPAQAAVATFHAQPSTHVVVVIPCASGTCEVRTHTPPAAHPVSPRPLQQNAEPPIPAQLTQR